MPNYPGASIRGGGGVPWEITTCFVLCSMFRGHLLIMIVHLELCKVQGRYLMMSNSISTSEGLTHSVTRGNYKQITKINPPFELPLSSLPKIIAPKQVSITHEFENYIN